MKIKLDSRLGNVALAISADIVETEKSKAAAYLDAMTFRLFHRAGSQAFKVKGGHKRDEVFSENLAADVKAATLNVLSEIFAGIEITTSPYVPQAPAITKMTAEEILKALTEDQKAALGIKVPKAVEAPASEEDVMLS